MPEVAAGFGDKCLEFVLELASNGKLEDEFKAFVAKASSDLGQMSRGGGDDAAADKKKVAAEADCARALSDFKAELQQALAANGKLEEELRRAVSAAPAQAEEASSKIASAGATRNRAV